MPSQCNIAEVADSPSNWQKIHNIPPQTRSTHNIQAGQIHSELHMGACSIVVTCLYAVKFEWPWSRPVCCFCFCCRILGLDFCWFFKKLQDLSLMFGGGNTQEFCICSWFYKWSTDIFHFFCCISAANLLPHGTFAHYLIGPKSSKVFPQPVRIPKQHTGADPSQNNWQHFRSEVSKSVPYLLAFSWTKQQTIFQHHFPFFKISKIVQLSFIIPKHLPDTLVTWVCKHPKSGFQPPDTISWNPALHLTVWG